MKWPHRRPLTWLVDVKRLLLQMGQSLSRLLLRHLCVGVLDEMHALHVMQWKKSWHTYVRRGAVQKVAHKRGGGGGGGRHHNGSRGQGGGWSLHVEAAPAVGEGRNGIHCFSHF